MRRRDWRVMACAAAWNLIGYSSILLAYLLFFFCLIYPDEMGVAHWLRARGL